MHCKQFVSLSVASLMLAAVLTGERPRLDMQRVLLMCLVHDLGEAYDGDIPAVAQMADGTKEACLLYTSPSPRD